MYLGPNFSENECKKAILKSKMNYSKSKKFYKEIAEYLDNGKIVGLFQGKMEFGPRALGNRSVLARTTDKNITKILNKRLSRTEFMPFAPITLEKFAREKYFMKKDNEDVIVIIEEDE